MTESISYARLFEPLAVRGQTLRNRVVMPPMVSLRGILSEDGRQWYEDRARGGVRVAARKAGG